MLSVRSLVARTSRASFSTRAVLRSQGKRRRLSSRHLAHNPPPALAPVATQHKAPAGDVALSSEAPGFRAPGAVPTNYELATGTQRFELLSQLKGEDPWDDMHPIVITRKGTKTDPIIVKGVDPVRYVACSGFPVDSHETLWLTLRPHKNGAVDRCPHCGSVFKYVQEYVDEQH